MRDDFTSTVDGAATFEAWHPDPFYEPLDDRPALADVVDDRPKCPECAYGRIMRVGTEHGRPVEVCSWQCGWMN